MIDNSNWFIHAVTDLVVPRDPYYFSVQELDDACGVTLRAKLTNFVVVHNFDRYAAAIRSSNPISVELSLLAARRHFGIISFDEYVVRYLDETIKINEAESKLHKILVEYYRKNGVALLDEPVVFQILDHLFKFTEAGTMEIEEDWSEFVPYILTMLNAAAASDDPNPLVDSYIALVQHWNSDITLQEYNKRNYTARGLPWWDMDLKYDSKTNEVEISFDYNHLFVEGLRKQGYFGEDDEIVDQFVLNWHKQALRDAGQYDPE